MQKTTDQQSFAKMTIYIHNFTHMQVNTVYIETEK